MASDARNRIGMLARGLVGGSREGWLPAAYDDYEKAAKQFAKEAKKEDTVSLVSELEGMGSRNETDPLLAVLPILLGLIEYRNGSAELCVEAFGYCVGAGGRLLRLGPELLRTMVSRGPDNYYVLWTVWAEYTHPDFPEELRLAAEDVEHERECLRRILRHRPEDPYVNAVLEWIDRHGRPYVKALERDVPIPVFHIIEQTRPSIHNPLPNLIRELDP